MSIKPTETALSHDLPPPPEGLSPVGGELRAAERAATPRRHETHQQPADYDALGRAVTTQDDDAPGRHITEVQLALVSMGYSMHGEASGPQSVGDDGIDGTMSPGLEAAIRQFQEDRDLEATGGLDPETYEAIFADYNDGLDLRRADAIDDNDGDGPSAGLLEPDLADLTVGEHTLAGFNPVDGADDPVAEQFEDKDEAPLG
jgi:hypothetical protein